MCIQSVTFDLSYDKAVFLLDKNTLLFKGTVYRETEFNAKEKQNI